METDWGTSYMKRIFRFFGDVGREMKKVVWPDVSQTKRDTATVIGTSILFAIFFAIIDGLLQWLLSMV